MSNGETTGSIETAPAKKPHYADTLKNEIAEQKAEIERLRAQLAGSTPPPSAAPIAEIVSAVNDPLAWITNDTPAVFLVSNTSAFFLRHANPRTNPPAEEIVLQTTSDPRPWGACPFDFRHQDRTIEQNNKVMMSKWHHHRITKDLAFLYWDHPAAKKPDKVVVDPAKFSGWNKLRKQANGEQVPVTDFVPLRELVRFMLQKNRTTFMNWGQHTFDFDRGVPNPYNNRLPDVGSAILRDIEAWKGKPLDSRIVS